MMARAMEKASPFLILAALFACAASGSKGAPMPATADARMATYNAGAALLDAGTNDEAAQLFENALRRSPLFVEAAEGLIEARSRRCAAQAAIAFIGQRLDSVSARDREVFLLYVEGTKARDGREFDKASVYFRNAAAAEREGADVVSCAFCTRALAECLLANHEGEEALEAARDFAALAAGLPKSERLLAEAHTIEAKCDDATARDTEADGLYRSTLALANRMGYRRVEGLALEGLGRFEDTRGKYGSAKEQYSKALALEQSMGDKGRVALLHAELGAVVVRLGAFGQAAEHFDQGEEIARSCNLIWILGQLAFGRGALAEARGDEEQAIKLFQESAAYRKEAGDVRGELEARLKLGLLYAGIGEYAKAVGQYEYALAAREDVKSLLTWSPILGELAQAYLRLGDLRKALEYWTETLEAARRLGDKRGVARSFGALGTIADRQGRFRDALSLEREAILSYEEMADGAGIAEAECVVGSVYAYLGRNEEALRHYESGYANAEASGSSELVAEAVRGMNSVYRGTGRLDLAERLGRRYLAYARSAKERTGVVRALDNLASIQIEQGRLDEARTSLREALALLPAGGEDYLRAETFYALGRAGGAASSSIGYLERSLALAEGNGIEELKWRCFTELGELYLARGDTARSYSLQHRAIVSIESLGRLAGSDEDRRRVLEPSALPYERIVSLILTRLGPARDAKEAFSYTERYRAQVLASLLREAMDRAGTRGDDRLFARERDILSKLTFYQARLLGGAISSAERADLIKRIDMLERRFVSLSIGFERGNKTYVEEMYPKVEQPDEMLSTLAPDECLLSYFFGEKRSFVFCGKNGVLSAYELPPRSEIERRVTDFLGLLREQGTVMEEGGEAGSERVSAPAAATGTLEREAGELFEMLIGPVAGELGPGAKLIIVGDGALSRLPFALLRSEGRYLVEDHDISYAPSLRSLRYVRDRNGVRARSNRTPEYGIIAVGAGGEVGGATRGGAPVGGTSADSATVGRATAGGAASGGGPSPPRKGGAASESMVVAQREGGEQQIFYPLTDIPIEPLARADDQAKEVASLFARARVLTGRAAEETSFRESRLDDAGIVHLEARTYVDDDEVMRSFIVLNPERSFEDTLASAAEDGLLRWHEAAVLKLNAALVTLSPCSRVPAERAVGGGLMGLAEAFLYAGGGCVVAEQLDVPDEPADRILIAYYRNVRKGMAAAAALSAAQRAALASRGPIARPAVWGAFVAIGDGASVPRLSRGFTRLMYLALILLAAAAALVVLTMLRRRR
jgi:CHAT domain-containing protein/tetratricopeptide (TPR) repeat protein